MFLLSKENNIYDLISHNNNEYFHTEMIFVLRLCLVPNKKYLTYTHTDTAIKIANKNVDIYLKIIYWHKKFSI